MAIRTGAEGTLAVVLRSIDHIGVAVADLDAAIAIHRDTYGMPLVTSHKRLTTCGPPAYG